jgi:hypothetical protein
MAANETRKRRANLKRVPVGFFIRRSAYHYISRPPPALPATIARVRYLKVAGSRIPKRIAGI